MSIARALAGEPKVLLLDEPAAGLDSSESALARPTGCGPCRDSGVTILLIDHDMSLVLGLCDQLHVLNFGSLIASGPPDHIRIDPAVIDAYLGATPPKEAVAVTGTPALECTGIHAGYDKVAVAREIDLSVAHGQVMTVLGPNGAGKTTLLLTMAGFLAPLKGAISLDGVPLRTGSARRMNRAGVVLVPDSRRPLHRVDAGTEPEAGGPTLPLVGR